ncbi:MAG: FAD-dependent monooxygenase [Gammaproteobacteria bacterium]
MYKTDIIIVGAGIVGAALACALGRANLNVVLIDSQVAADPQFAAQDLRVSAVTYGNKQWLSKLGVWEQLNEQQLGLFRTMQVLEQNSELLFDSADLGVPTLGYIVPNQLLNNALLQQLKTMQQVQILRPVVPESLQFSKHQVLLTLPEEQISAKLIVGADGAQSWVREQCKFGMESKSYEHTALVAHLQIEKTHQQCAYQQFKLDDVLAFLPLADTHQCSLVWSGKPERIQELQSLSTENFTAQLQSHWGDSLGKITILSERKTFPLTMRHAKNYVQERVAIIGDAAHTIHPLAGQGLNLGLQDAQCLATTLIDIEQQQRDVGRYSNLRSFERERRWNNDLMLKIVGGNKWMFAQTDSTVTCLRKTGMQAINNCPAVKKKIMQLATFGALD